LRDIRFVGSYVETGAGEFLLPAAATTSTSTDFARSTGDGADG
jgi:hypothetical protein